VGQASSLSACVLLSGDAKFLPRPDRLEACPTLSIPNSSCLPSNGPKQLGSYCKSALEPSTSKRANIYYRQPSGGVACCSRFEKRTHFAVVFSSGGAKLAT
jgi:hypothetical protein